MKRKKEMHQESPKEWVHSHTNASKTWQHLKIQAEMLLETFCTSKVTFLHFNAIEWFKDLVKWTKIVKEKLLKCLIEIFIKNMRQFQFRKISWCCGFALEKINKIKQRQWRSWGEVKYWRCCLEGLGPSGRGGSRRSHTVGKSAPRRRAGNTNMNILSGKNSHKSYD